MIPSGIHACTGTTTLTRGGYAPKPALPRTIYGANTYLGVNMKHWAMEAQARMPQQGRTMVAELLH